MRPRRTKVWFDGGCRPNPGPIEAAAVVRGSVHRFTGLGSGSSTDAEWLALVRALELAHELGLAEVELVGDALPVIRAARAALKSGVAPHSHAAAFLAAASRLHSVALRWVRRGQNLAGIALAATHPR